MSKQKEQQQLQSAEWYAARFEELRKWAKDQENRADKMEQEFAEKGHVIASARCLGRANVAFRVQRWIDFFVRPSK